MRSEDPDVVDRHRHRTTRRSCDALRRPAGVHARRTRRRLRVDAGGAAQAGGDRPAREPDRAGARRGVRARLGRVRARGRARPARQRRHRLLDREPRSDGDAHRGLRDGRSADDASRRGVPGTARRGDRRHPSSRRRHGRVEHPVRALARDRRRARDRDEPARVALVRARVEGDGLSDREGRREARGRVHARRDPERPDRDDAGELRADARLRRRQVPALRVREVPRRRPHARDADEVRRRDDGHRPHVRRGVPEGDALARARRGRGYAVADARRRARGRASVLRRGDLADPGGAARDRRQRRRAVRRRRLAAAEAARHLRQRHRGRRRRPRDRRCARAAATAACARSTGASTRAAARSRRRRTTTTPPGARRKRLRRRARSLASSFSVRDRTASARASSSTTAACTPCGRSASSATSR